MTTLDSAPASGSLLAAMFADDTTFTPAEPNSIEESGLSASMIESLICKYVLVIGSASGREIAEQVCLPFRTLEGIFRILRQRQILVHSSSAQMNDYYYTLTDNGRQWTQRMMESCGYVGPAPVPLVDYVVSVEAQTIRAEAPEAAASGQGLLGHFRGARLVRSLGTGHQFRRGTLPVRCTGQRENNACRSHHHVFWPGYLDSPDTH